MLAKVFLFFFIFLGLFNNAQIKIQGTVKSLLTDEEIADAQVVFADNMARTDSQGRFEIELPCVDAFIEISAPGFFTFSKFIDLASECDSMYINIPSIDLKEIKLEKAVDIYSFDIQELQQEEGETVPGNLSAYKDVYSNIIAYDFRQINFNRRGLSQEYTTATLNGLKVNDSEYGRPIWSWWGGLNDVFKNQNNSVSTGYFEYQIPTIGGAVNFDTRPSNFNKSYKVSFSGTNLSYLSRLMVSYASGKSEKGWSFLANTSFRWGDSTFYPGIFYNAISAFISAEKEINSKNIVSITGFYAPVNKSGRTAITEEEAHLSPAGKQYNPYWGYQNGQIRYSRVQKSRQPFLMLTYYYTPHIKTQIQVNASYRWGKYGRTRLEYQGQSNPNPNNYKNLPSYFPYGSNDYLAAKNAFENDENYNQINWERLYQSNMNAPFTTVPNASGSGMEVTGKQAYFIVENQISNDRQFLANFLFTHQLTPNLQVVSGGYFSTLRRNYYKELSDLLGGEFWVDIDKFLAYNYSPYSNETQNNIDTPNRIITPGDKFGYNYDINTTHWNIFSQIKRAAYPLDYFVALNIGMASYGRKGYYRKGSFPNNSLGKSNIYHFMDYQINTGCTFYINGKNYVDIKGMYQEKAPKAEWIFTQARNNNSVIPNLKTERIWGGDISYSYKTDLLRFIVSAYYYQKNNALERNLLLFDLGNDNDELTSDFLSVVAQNISQQYVGIEIGGELQVNSTIKIFGALAFSKNEYINNPILFVSNDDPISSLPNENTTLSSLNGSQAYYKGLDVGFVPQLAGSIGIEYRNPAFWFIKASASYFAHSFVSPNPLNRTKEVLENRIKNNPTLTAEELIRQANLKQGLSINIGAGKSWRLKNKKYLSMNLFINNILNNPMQTWAYEQTRYEKEYGYFNKYSYTPGITFFANLSYNY